MAFTATTILELLVFITWACLSIRGYRNGIFRQLVPSQAILSEMCSAASLTFAPGLFDAVQAASPPAVSFFLSLPSDSSRRWAVYALVLEKPDALSLIYIGSGTDARDGLRSRWRHYEKPDFDMLPEHVLAALKDGYSIVHKGTLVWSPLPSAANVPIFRVLFIAMEAAFTFLFWAVKSRKPDHFMISCCPWPLASFSYGGLCSHSPLQDSVQGRFDLSAEQLEAIAAANKEKNAAKLSQYRQDHPDLIKATKNRSFAKVKASKKFYCTLCGVSCAKPWELKRHNSSERHRLRVEKAAEGIENKYRCVPCDYSTSSASAFCTHKKSQRHLRNVAAAT